MIRVLANDGLEASAVKALEAAGAEVVTSHVEQADLGEAVRDYDVLIVRSATKVTAEVSEKAKGSKLKLVIRAGVGVDNIDIPAGNEVGVTTKNTPAASSDSVAELALAHMFSLARFVGIANVTMRNGEWNKKKYEGSEILGKTLGIIGMGRIGQSLAAKAEALGMKVVYTDLFGKNDKLAYEFLSLEDLLKTSDFISLHVPYDKNQGSLIGKAQFDMMKDGVFLIDCARGKVVEEAALLEALNSGKVAGAGLDVYEEEPTKNTELVNHPRVSATPHIGAATKEAQTRIGEEVVSTIKTFFNL